jgi:hypothetical protein
MPKSKLKNARALVRQILTTDADIEPDYQEGILKIKIHNLTNPRYNEYANQLCKVLNESETIFPGTNLRLLYNLVSNEIPTGQEV